MSEDYGKESESLATAAADAVRAVIASQRPPFKATVTTGSEDDAWEAIITISVREKPHDVRAGNFAVG